jgi:hypothetical protein
MVRVAVEGVPKVAWVGLLRLRLTVSLGSVTPSFKMVTVKVLVRSEVVKVNVPEVVV